MEQEPRQLTFEDLNDPEIEVRILSPERLFKIADAELLIRLGKDEDGRFERKSSKIEPKVLGEYFSMWANTPQGGLLVVGQEDNCDLTGLLSLSVKKLNALEEAPSTYCPDAVYHKKRIDFNKQDGTSDFILLFYVEYHGSRSVRTTKGKYFQRVGQQKRELRDEAEIRHLKQEKNEVSAELEPIDLRYPQDFNTAAIGEWFQQVMTKGGLTPDYQSPESVLTDNRLGTQTPDGFVPNLACALLFAKRPTDVVPGARIRFLRFDGKEQGTGSKWNATKDEFIEGTIPTQIAGCAKILDSQLRNFSKLGPGGKFYTASEYPEEAWYEALVNACVHRTYSNGLQNSPIFVRMFDDRLEVESPGPLPPFVTPQNIYEMHNPRNPRLMNAMLFMGFVKMAHEGTRRMRDTMKEVELPEPEFRQQEMGSALVKVTLRNSIEHRRVWVDSDVADFLGAGIARTLNEEQKRCVNWTAEQGGGISVSDVQRLTAKTWPASKKFLEDLRERGIFRFKHSDKDRDPKARYVLVGFDLGDD